MEPTVEEPPQEEVEKPVETLAPIQQPTAPVQKAPSPEKPTNEIAPNNASNGNNNKEEQIDDENMELDFEEISEDELEEETRVKGIGDALGVDWSSLVAESRPRVKPISSAKIRWESNNVLINLGISVEMAGEKLVKDIVREYQEQKKTAMKMDDEVHKYEKEVIVKTENVTIKTEIEDVKIKTEPEDVKDTAEEIVNIDNKEDLEDLTNLDPIASIQVAKREKNAIRKSLFACAGPYRRALSARRDLVIRRHLCNLPVIDTFVEAPKRHDPELYKLATQIFERCL